MTPERWQQIERVYHAALERDMAERAAFLTGVCGDDHALRHEIESLLAQESVAAGFLSAPAVPVANGMTSDGMSLMGRQLGPYEIHARLGAGGMGEVYRARDAKLGRDVAIKILTRHFTADPERLVRFEREARLLAAFNHPHIGAIYGLEVLDTMPALVLELVEGDTLAERIAHGPPPIADALTMATQIADALEAAHDKGIIHRDLKPSNIKVTPDGVVKVLDFGLAKAMSGDGSGPDLSQSPTISIGGTRDGVILGTAPYMSPEQARGKPVDKRTDIWAYGCVLYEMLTGDAAFAGDTVSDTIAKILEREPDWGPLPDTTPSGVRRLLQRCLEKDPKLRLRDIGEARIALTRSADEDPVQAPQRSGRPWTRTKALVAVGAVVLVLASVASVGALAIRAARRAPPAQVELSQFVILPPEKANFTSDLSAQAISPDGRRIVFLASTADGTSQLWIRSLDALSARSLAGTDGATLPFWSPDSRSIGFFAAGKLKRIDVAGGPAQILADVSTAFGGAWSRAGVILFGTGFNSLFRVPAGGGAATQVTSLVQTPPGFVHAAPFFLPDGRHFLFRALTGPTTGDVYAGSLDSKDVKLVLRDSTALYALPGYLLFLRESTLMAQPFDSDRLSTSGDAVPVMERVGSTNTRGFAVSENGTLLYRSASAVQTQLVWVDRAGQPRGIAAPPGSYDDLALSLDDKRVAFDRRGPDGMGVWLVDFDRRITSRLTRPASINNVPIWSPDGRTVVFVTGSADGLDIYQRPSNESGPPEPVLELHAQPIVFPSDWSSDGRFLAYYRTDTKTQLDLWVLPFFGDRKPFPLLHGDFNESQGQFSPDGRWIAYVSDESGTRQIYVQSFPALTDKRQISIDGGTQPRWRRDGKEVFYLAPDRKLMAVTVKAGANFEADIPQALFETVVDVAALRQTYSVAMDGQRFLLNSPVDAETPPMTIVLNWPALIGRR